LRSSSGCNLLGSITFFVSPDRQQSTSLLCPAVPQAFSGREAIEGYITDLFQRHNPSERITKMSYVYAFGGDLCALGGWTVTIDGSQKFGGYLVIVYTFVGGTWKIRSSVFKYPTS
jgi:hypothetical protein